MVLVWFQPLVVEVVDWVVVAGRRVVSGWNDVSPALAVALRMAPARVGGWVG